MWTAIISEKFTDFIERAATAIIRLTLFSLAASYKMYSISLQTKYGNFVNWVKKKKNISVHSSYINIVTDCFNSPAFIQLSFSKCVLLVSKLV